MNPFLAQANAPAGFAPQGPAAIQTSPFPQVAQASVAGFAPMNPFEGLENAKMPGSGRPRLAENFSYVVEVTDYKIYKTNIITEYTVVQSSGGSPVGSISSCVRKTERCTSRGEKS